MSLFGISSGLPQTVSAFLTTTTATDVLTAGNNGVDVTQIIACNQSGSAVTVTLSRYDGVTEYKIWGALSVAANKTETLEVFIRLLRGEKIRVTAGTASQLYVHVNHVVPN